MNIKLNKMLPYKKYRRSNTTLLSALLQIGGVFVLSLMVIGTTMSLLGY